MNKKHEGWSTSDEIGFFNELVAKEQEKGKSKGIIAMKLYKRAIDARVDFGEINPWELKEYVNRRISLTEG